MRRPAQGPARGRQRPRLVPVVPPRQWQQLPAAAPAGPAAQPGPHQPEDTRPGAAMGGGLALPPATSSPPDAIAPDACSLKIGDLVVSVGGQTAPEESIKVKKKSRVICHRCPFMVFARWHSTSLTPTPQAFLAQWRVLDWTGGEWRHEYF